MSKRKRSSVLETGQTEPAASQVSPQSVASNTDQIGRSLELLARVRAGTISGPALAPVDRQALVCLLMADGLSTPEIAQVLQVADRTIERDRKAIRAGLAVPRDPKLVEQMVGRLVAEAELSVQRIRRTTREREVEPAVKVDAEHRCFEIVRDLVQSLQRLGYLPTATQKVEADLTHHVGELPSLADLQSEIERLKQVDGTDSGAGYCGLIEVEKVVTRATLASQVRDIVSTQDGVARQQEEHDHVTQT